MLFVTKCGKKSVQRSVKGALSNWKKIYAKFSEKMNRTPRFFFLTSFTFVVGSLLYRLQSQSLRFNYLEYFLNLDTFFLFGKHF